MHDLPPEALAWLKAPVEMRTREQLTLQKGLLEEEDHPGIVRLLIEIEFEYIAGKRQQELASILAEVARLGQYFVFCYLFELLGHRPLVVDPFHVGVDAKYQKVYQRYQIISSAQSDLSKGIFAREDDISFEWNILLKLNMLTLLVQVLLRYSKINEVYLLL